MAVTRAMFVTVLGRLAGVDPDDYGNTSGFDDVKEGWYSGYVAWAVENGIVKGRSEKIFRSRQRYNQGRDGCHDIPLSTVHKYGHRRDRR